MRYCKIIPAMLCIMAMGAACGQKKGKPRQQEVVKTVQQLDEVVPQQIVERLQYVDGNDGLMEDSVMALSPAALHAAYDGQGGKAIWSSNGKAIPQADSLFRWIRDARLYGLNPAHYHAAALQQALERRNTDKESLRDAALWAQTDVLLTDAFFKLASHLHYGVIPRDSIALRKDSLLTDDVLNMLLREAITGNHISEILQSREPTHEAYRLLKIGLAEYESRYKDVVWDTLPSEYTDTVAFRHQLAVRLAETGHLDTLENNIGDTVALKKAVKQFQQEINLYPDGVAGKRTIQYLNRQPGDWIEQAGINLDRWRKMPDTLPARYLMVNIPAFRLQVWDDSAGTVLESRVIVGTPRTRTPQLSSVMTNFVLYPYWRVPYSIVFKEMLPQIKKNRHYLVEKNLEVVDHHGNIISPDSIDWQKLNKNYFPYVLRQMDGLDNSLGIMKFNFANRFSVYLHDTNNRKLFANSNRALSHGCVRVQAWDSLAMYLVSSDPRPEMADSVRAWLSREEQRTYAFPKRLPIYIRYFSSEYRDGRLRFYEDVYGEDARVRQYLR
ncbi:L,D-transpeptidase family protein [Chitinophaga caseinilytica]|uniref:L,D-transpeptidase family protein n=1 Tax=Chitinophaga caseinilytica TaxID=2267521 RepID=UPI003C2B202A